MAINRRFIHNPPARSTSDQPINRKAVSIGWMCCRALFLFGIALAVCVVVGLAFLLVITEGILSG